MQNSRMRPKASGLEPLSLILLMSLVLAGCAGPALDDYQSTGPDLVPSQFFTGELSARGVVKDFSGEVIRTFDADIVASWDDNGVGTLINQTTMSKWGVDVGEVVLVIQKKRRGDSPAILITEYGQVTDTHVEAMAGGACVGWSCGGRCRRVSEPGRPG